MSDQQDFATHRLSLIRCHSPFTASFYQQLPTHHHPLQAESEYGRQRDYLEQTVESLKRKLAKDVDKARADNMRIMAEHVALVQEINELRREMKAVRAGMPGTTNTGAEARGLGKGAAGGVQRSGSLLPPLRRGAGSGPQRAGSLRGAGLRSVGGSGRASPAVMDGEMLAQMDAMRVSQEGAGVDGNGAWVAGAGRRSRPASGGLPPLGGGAGEGGGSSGGSSEGDGEGGSGGGSEGGSQRGRVE